MKRYVMVLASGLCMASCNGYGSNPAGEYASYNCNQLSMERYALTDELKQANGEESSNQIYQLAMAAFAMSNGNSYSTKADSRKADELNLRMSEVRREAIRKECRW
jgi:hypothetical protein